MTIEKFVASLLDDTSDDSFSKKLDKYKKQHDDDKANKRKDTSDFLAKLIKDLPQPITSNLAYNFLLGLKFILSAQKKLLEEDKDISKSLFLITIINGLNFNLTNPITAEKPKELKQPLIATEKKQKKMSSALDAIITKINAELNTYQPPLFDDELNNALKGLFDYCARKEFEEQKLINLGIGNHPEKRQKVYEVLNAYHIAKTPEDFVKLFQAIKDGIQLSRSIGESRESELALITFRDALLKLLLNNKNILDTFTLPHLNIILDAVSHGSKDDVNTEVSKHTLTLISKIEASEKSLNIFDQTESYKRVVTHLNRAICCIPDKINKEKIDKIEECYKLGPQWGEMLRTLLMDKNFTEDTSLKFQNYLVFENCTKTWNEYMKQLAEDRKPYLPIIVILQSPAKPLEEKEKKVEGVKKIEEVKPTTEKTFKEPPAEPPPVPSVKQKTQRFLPSGTEPSPKPKQENPPKKESSAREIQQRLLSSPTGSPLTTDMFNPKRSTPNNSSRPLPAPQGNPPFASGRPLPIPQGSPISNSGRPLPNPQGRERPRSISSPPGTPSLGFKKD
jgi:hypothetical protein